MRASALEFARRLRGRVGDGQIDLLFATSLVDLGHLLALLPRRLPSVLYFHENQAAYPHRQDESVPERDLHYAFTNLSSALAADHVAFNSAHQRDAFFAAMEALVRRMPDARPLWALEEIERKSSVLPLGVRLSDIPERKAPDGGPPVVLWNHRWEHDKAPEVFFGVLLSLAERELPFRVAVAGESFAQVPEVFRVARERLAQRIAHWGYVPERTAYAVLLAGADIVVSTAVQENFGLSLVEGAYAGAHPLAPNRLSYPEVLPRAIHEACLYESEHDLFLRLEALITGRMLRTEPRLLRELMASHRWEARAERFDRLIGQVFERGQVWYKE